MCDDEENGDKMEITVNNFKPGHTSTQVVDHPSSPTPDLSATVSFAPYTLPSLKTVEPEDDEEKTQPFSGDAPKDNILSKGVVWKEVKKVKPQNNTTKTDDMLDELWNDEEDGGKKRVRDETSPQQQESKKIKTIGLNDLNDSINVNSQDNHIGGNNKRKVAESDESIFSLPPRARQREVSTSYH